MHIVKDLPNELQDTHSLSFLYHYACTSCKQTSSIKMISFKTSHSFLMFKFTDVTISNFIMMWRQVIMDFSPPVPHSNDLIILLFPQSISFTIIVTLLQYAYTINMKLYMS